MHEPRAVQTVGEGRDAARLSQLDDHGQMATPRQRIEEVGCAKAGDKIAGDKHLSTGAASSCERAIEPRIRPLCRMALAPDVNEAFLNHASV